MRWLLLKDLQILKRSPLLVAVLVGYSVVVSLVAGAALSAGPTKPRVAFANLVPEDKSEVALGGRRVDATQYADKLFEKVTPIRVKTREQAIAKVENGEAVAAWRGAEFARWREEGTAFRGAIPSFNLLQAEGKAEWSPLMERAASCTRSVTQVEADFARGEIAMRHWPRESLATLGEPATARLELRCGASE